MFWLCIIVLKYNVIRYFKNKKNIPEYQTVNISKQIKRKTGWFFQKQLVQDLYTWMVNNYGDIKDLNGYEGGLLRTMDPKSYFIFVQYFIEQKC